jgi:S1-C subfamily serine protease
MAFGRSNSPTPRAALWGVLAGCAVIVALSAKVALGADASGLPDDTDSSGPQVVSPQPFDPQEATINDYLRGRDDDMSPLGVDVRVDQRKLKSGEEKVGLLVVAVTSGGPAAKAGLHGMHHRVKTVVEEASVAAGFLFPPAAPLLLLVPILESTSVGESYDLIVAVDGFRVTDILDFEDCMRDVKPGEIVYLSLVRDGVRVQLPVPLPEIAPSPRD